MSLFASSIIRVVNGQNSIVKNVRVNYLTAELAIITVCNEVAKVMFLHLSVIRSQGEGSASVHAGIPSWEQPPQEADPPGKQTPSGSRPPPGDGCGCGQYASYWNAFLLQVMFTHCVSSSLVLKQSDFRPAQHNTILWGRLSGSWIHFPQCNHHVFPEQPR